MSETQNSTRCGATAHARTSLRIPTVRPIINYPGLYVADFGDLTIHFTAADWDAIDTAVRSGIAALMEPVTS